MVANTSTGEFFFNPLSHSVSYVIVSPQQITLSSFGRETLKFSLMLTVISIRDDLLPDFKETLFGRRTS